MPVKVSTHKVPDSYLKLVKHFPLIHLRDEAHLDETLGAPNDLLRQTGMREPKRTWTT